jgi:hypothetical protein
VALLHHLAGPLEQVQERIPRHQGASVCRRL